MGTDEGKSADLTVDIKGNGAYEEFCEIDLADDIIEWLIKEGVEFESKRSMLFNCNYITEVMISREKSMHEVLGSIDQLTDEKVERRASYFA